MLWVGLLLVALGGVGLYFAGKAADRVLHMKATDTSQIGDLRRVMDEVRKDLGGGPSELREFVEIKGTVGCSRPLQAELSGESAAIVQTRVVRELEELKETRDSEGNTTSKWVSRSETVSSTNLDAPFWLDDGTGRVDVRPTGATFTLHKVVDRFEPEDQVQSGGALSFGGFSFNVGSFSRSNRLRVKGYRLTESILPIGARVYALGEFSDTSDGVALHRPADKEKPFVLSTKSEEEMVQAGESSAKIYKYVGFGGIGLGVVLIIVGAIRMIAS